MTGQLPKFTFEDNFGDKLEISAERNVYLRVQEGSRSVMLSFEPEDAIQAALRILEAAVHVGGKIPA